jgi:hypothetical protein
MKSSLFEHYKAKYKVGGKTPVNAKGMWYQNGDVVVPSNNITMKGPKGESDYFNSPIMGIGMQSGTTKVMQPGKDYTFPNDKSVYETKKFQQGGVDYQKRLNEYMAKDTQRSKVIPKGVSLDTDLKDIQNQYLRQMDATKNVGDLSPQVLEAIRSSGINLSSRVALPSELGNLNYSGSYNPFDTNASENLLNNLSYSKNLPKGSIRVSPNSQTLNLRSKDSNLSVSRRMSDSEILNQLNFNTQVLPEILSVYGGTEFKGKDAVTLKSLDPLQLQANVDANLGIQGQVGPLRYNVEGQYNPKTGMTYEGEASLNLLKDRLNISGNIQAENQAVQGYNVGANLDLGRNINLSGSYSKQANQPGNYNIGLSYMNAFEEGGEIEDEEDEEKNDKEMVEGIADILRRVKDKNNRKQIAKQMVDDFEEEDVEYSLDDFMEAAKVMQMGGMSIPGVNGTVVASISPVSLKDTYKKKKKK